MACIRASGRPDLPAGAGARIDAEIDVLAYAPVADRIIARVPHRRDQT